MAKTEPVTEGDRLFMAGVVEVNVAFAHGYAQLQAQDPSNVRGINYDPDGTAFNPARNLPNVGGVPTRDPSSRSRIIGDVRLPDRCRARGRRGSGHPRWPSVRRAQSAAEATSARRIPA